MFDHRGPSDGLDIKNASAVSVAELRERVRPTSLSRSRVLAVTPPLGALFGDGGLRRGTTVTIASRHPSRTGRHLANGEVTLALALAAGVTGSGLWCALVGLGDLGAEAAHDLGVGLDRLALVAHPGRVWAEVTAALLDGMDLVVLSPPFTPQAAMARRLVARARERRSVLAVLPGRVGWPEHPDVHLTIDALRWEGAGSGDGHLIRRHGTVLATGRRDASRGRRRPLWIPGESGRVEHAAEEQGGVLR